MATMDAYLDSLKLELNKCFIALKNFTKIDFSTFFTPENLNKLKEQFMANAQKTVDGVLWNDRFIMIVCMIHVFILIEIFQSRKSYFKQIFYVICLSVLSLSGTFLNDLGAQYWNKFAARNYFDKNGQFMLLFLNIPVLIELILCLLIICVLSLEYLLSPSKSQPKKTKNAKKAVKKSKPEPKMPAMEQSKRNVKPEKKPVKINRQKFN